MSLARLAAALPLLAVLSEKGKAIGTTSLGQVSIGFALGGQEYGYTPFGEKKK